MATKTITTLFKAKPLNEKLPVTRKEFLRERAYLGDEIDRLYRSIVRLAERLDETQKENKEMRNLLKIISKRVLD